MAKRSHGDLAVVVITRNAPEELAKTLSYMAPSLATCLLLVSDDSDDPIPGRHLASAYHGRWTAGPRQGPVANRFHGLRDAQRWHPSHVLFIDDDITITAPTWQALTAGMAEYPREILCPVAIELGVVVRPTQVTWRGFRARPAPSAGGYGLMDACMLWPVEAALAVEWDTTFRYGYAEAWIGYQAMRTGHPVRVLDEASIIHRRPGHGAADPAHVAHLDEARVFYNYLIQSSERGALVAGALLAVDAFLTNVRRIQRGHAPDFRAYRRLSLLARTRP